LRASDGPCLTKLSCQGKAMGSSGGGAPYSAYGTAYITGFPGSYKNRTGVRCRCDTAVWWYAQIRVKSRPFLMARSVPAKAQIISLYEWAGCGVCALVRWQRAPGPVLEAEACTQSVPACGGVRWRYSGGTVAYGAGPVPRSAHRTPCSMRWRCRTGIVCGVRCTPL
jgi:hypothetical protein